jgi:hypothetical protein
MDVVAAIITKLQMPVLMHPAFRPFHHPAVDAQAAAMLRSSFCQNRLRSSGSELPTMRFGVIATIALDSIESVTRSATLASNSGNGVHQRQQLRDVVTIRSSQRESHHRAAIAVHQQMMLRTALSPIYWIWACFFPPCIARTEAESTTARDQSILSAALSLSSSTWCNRRHTPATFQSRSRRQQVIPQPQPISCGRYSHGIPVFSTNTMPASTLRSSTGGRPPRLCRSRRRGCGVGSNGFMICHKSSVTSGRAILTSDNDRRSFSTIKASNRNQRLPQFC